MRFPSQALPLAPVLFQAPVLLPILLPAQPPVPACPVAWLPVPLRLPAPCLLPILGRVWGTAVSARPGMGLGLAQQVPVAVPALFPVYLPPRPLLFLLHHCSLLLPLNRRYLQCFHAIQHSIQRTVPASIFGTVLLCFPVTSHGIHAKPTGTTFRSVPLPCQG